MRSVSYRLVDLKNVKINLGFQGENEHTTVVFDCKKAFDQYPDAVCSLSVISPHGEKYPAITTREGNYVSWVVTDSDLAYPGDGMLQLSFMQGSVIKKTYKPKTHIDDSIIAGDNPPSGVENWLDTANRTLTELPDTAKEYALDALDEMTVEAEMLPEGSEPVVEKTVDPDTGAINLDFMIPSGGSGTTDYEDLENKPTLGGVTLNGAVTLQDVGAYEKPSGGIPASDLADGVIPDVSGKANLAVIAPAFDQATANDPGSLVTYTDGVVYVLPDGHAAGATWANTTKTATNIAEQQRALLTAIDGIEESAKKGESADKKINTLFNPDHTSLFEVGSMYTSNGQNVESTTRLRTTGYIPEGLTAIIPDSGYKFMLFAYDKSNNKYLGTWNGSTFVKDGNWLTNGVNFAKVINGNYYYRLLCATINNDTVTLQNDAKHINIIWETDVSVSKSGLSADAKATGDKFNTITDNAVKNHTDYIFGVAIRDKYQFSAADFEAGSFNLSYMNKTENSKRLRTKYLIPVKVGMMFSYNNPYLDVNMFVFASKAGSIAQTTDWISAGGSGTITINHNGYLVILLNSQNDITISDYSGTYEIVCEKTDVNNPLFFYKSYNQESIPVSTSALSYSDFMTTTWEAFRTAFSNNVTRNVLINDTSDTFPIYEYIVTPSEHYTHTILVAAGMHGDEYEGFWSLYRIMSFLYRTGYKYEKTRDMLRNTKFIILPVLNPYGVEHRTRGNSANANAQDNYDVRWDDQSYRRTGTTPFQYNESKAVKLALEAHNDIEMFIEFHTDPYNPEKGNYTEVIETSSLIPMAYNITLDERQNLKNEYDYTSPLSQNFVVWPTQQCNSIRYVEEVWNIPAILMETGIGGAANTGTATQMEIAFNWYINCMIQAIKTLD